MIGIRFLVRMIAVNLNHSFPLILIRPLTVRGIPGPGDVRQCRIFDFVAQMLPKTPSGIAKLTELCSVGPDCHRENLSDAVTHEIHSQTLFADYPREFPVIRDGAKFPQG